MAYTKSLVRILVLSLLITTPIHNAGAAGRTSTSPLNTILNGKGAPRTSLGIDGDFYIDVRSLLIYGPKTKGKWPKPQNIQGPTGATGSDGRNGADGKSVGNTNVSSVVGQQGPQGATGRQGEKGEKGETGDAGPIGPAGLPGAPGAAGSSGSNGAPGPQGPAGATGAVGPSEVTVVEVPTWNLGSATQYSYSASPHFGNLVSGNSYHFQLHINGTSDFNSLVLGLDVVSPGNVVTFTFSRNDFRYSTYSSTGTWYAFDVTGTIKVNAANGSLQVRIIDGFGDTGSNPLELSGKAYITLVGAIK